jgi:hypothetical protein
MRIALILAALAIPIAAGATVLTADEDHDDLIGVWKLRSFSLQVLGEPAREIFGANPQGYLILTAEGRMMTILTRADRKPATTVEEQAALLQSMVAYSGRYTIEGDRLITRPDVTWNEIYSGTEQVRYYSLSGDTLSLTTAPQSSGILPGKRVIATLTYQREK